ncbi:hypothetical protein [Synechococcus sp. BDU 130192]|nr:hypothetical protein [Synechococcus sp. BDU 130192]
MTIRLSPSDFEILSRQAESHEGNMSLAIRNLLRAAGNEKSAA